MRPTLRSWLQLIMHPLDAVLVCPQALQTMKLPLSLALHSAERHSAPLYSGASFRQHLKLPLSTDFLLCRVFTVRADTSIEPACVGLNSVQRKVSDKASITSGERRICAAKDELKPLACWLCTVACCHWPAWQCLQKVRWVWPGEHPG